MSKYAVVETGGKQVLVAPGERIYVERIPGNPGDEVVLKKVVLLGGDKVAVGSPYVEGAKVTFRLEKQGLGKKVVIYKYKAKANERKKQGHRQPYTCLVCESIAG